MYCGVSADGLQVFSIDIALENFLKFPSSSQTKSYCELSLHFSMILAILVLISMLVKVTSSRSSLGKASAVLVSLAGLPNDHKIGRGGGR